MGLENKKLRISEMFSSIQGETTLVGLPTYFVRLTGCPLRCVWCDSEYAFSGGKNISLADIIINIQQSGHKYVTVTGGEPLAQKNSIELMRSLLSEGYCVSLETSGALSVVDVPKGIIKIIDVKCPDSGESEKNLIENFKYLQEGDQIKFVIGSRNDYEWAIDFYQKWSDDLIVIKESDVLFSPVFNVMSPDKLISWMLADKLNFRFQLQAHKFIWGDVPGR